MKVIVLLFGIGAGAAVTIAAVGFTLLVRDARVLLSRDDLYDVDWDTVAPQLRENVPQLRLIDGDHEGYGYDVGPYL